MNIKQQPYKHLKLDKFVYGPKQKIIKTTTQMISQEDEKIINDNSNKKNVYYFSDINNNLNENPSIKKEIKDIKEDLDQNTNIIKDKIRIVHYKTEESIPHIFFEKPFYFVNKRDTTFDKILSLNSNVINSQEYKNDELYNLFLEQNFGSVNRITDIELYKSLYSTYNKNVRLTDRDIQYRTFMNCLFQYPNSIHYEDKAYLINYIF